MAKDCGCYEKHRKNRSTKRRLFTIKDFLRIAIYVNRDTGIKPLGLIAELAYQFGYGSMFGLASRTLTQSNKTMSQLRQLLSAIAAAKIIKFILMLKTTPLLEIPIVGTIVSFFILLATFATKGIKALDFFSDNVHVEHVAADLMESHVYLVNKYGSETFDDYPELDLLDAIEEFARLEVESFDAKVNFLQTVYDFYNYLNHTNLQAE